MKLITKNSFYLDRKFDFSDPYCTFEMKNKTLFTRFCETIHLDLEIILKVFDRLKNIANWAPEKVRVFLDLRKIGSIDVDCVDLLKDPSDYLVKINANISSISAVLVKEWDLG